MFFLHGKMDYTQTMQIYGFVCYMINNIFGYKISQFPDKNAQLKSIFLISKLYITYVVGIHINCSFEHLNMLKCMVKKMLKFLCLL